MPESLPQPEMIATSPRKSQGRLSGTGGPPQNRSVVRSYQSPRSDSRQPGERRADLSMPATSANAARLSALLETENERYRASHPRSLALADQASRSLLNGVPMSWMTHWATPFPLFMERANGARLWDVDGNEYIDFCLGDTGAMAGHSPPATAEA